MSRALDAAVARALGREVVERGGEYWYGGGVPHRVEPFSECGNVMLELIAEMLARGYGGQFRIKYDYEYEEYIVDFGKRYPNACQRGYGDAKLLPKAVAHAACETLTGKEWEGGP